MKKRTVSAAAFALVFALIYGLFIPAFAADSAGLPGKKEPNGYVSNSYGAFLYSPEYSEDGTLTLALSGSQLDYEDKVTAVDVITVDGEDYYELYADGLSGRRYVSFNDVTLDLQPVEPSGKYKYAGALYYTVINPDGAKIYEGPGRIYDEVDVIPYGTEVKTQYSSAADSWAYGWSYIAFEDVSGWADTSMLFSSFDFALSVKSRPIAKSPLGEAVTTKELKLYSELNIPDLNLGYEGEYQKTRPAAKIPAGTAINFDNYYLDSDNNVIAFIEYDGTQGWARLTEGSDCYNRAMFNVDGYLLNTGKNRELYKDDGLKPGELLDYEPAEGSMFDGTLGENIIVPYDWSYIVPQDDALAAKLTGNPGEKGEAYFRWYRININDEYYWVKFDSLTDETPCIFSGGSLNRLTLKQSLAIRVYFDENASQLGELPSGEEFYILFEYENDGTPWAYVRYNGIDGWVELYVGDYESVDTFTVPVVTLGEMPVYDDAQFDSSGKDDDGKTGTSAHSSFVGKVLLIVIVIVIAVIFISGRIKKKKRVK